MKIRRLRTFTLWTAALLCVLIAAVFVLSGWWIMAVQVPAEYGPALGATGGMLVVILAYSYSEVWVVEPAAPSPSGGCVTLSASKFTAQRLRG